MKIRQHIATISFCTNLTGANSEAIPVGVLILGERTDHAMALLLVREDAAFFDTLPRLIRSIVKDFPQMLQAQLEEILENDNGGSIDSVMKCFEDSRRNSFFVSDLKWGEEIVVPDMASGDGPTPWMAAMPSVVKRANEGMVAAHVMPDEMRQHFKPWMHGGHSHMGQSNNRR